MKIIFEDNEDGLLVGLQGKEKISLGLGILQEKNYEHMILKVYTRVKRDVASIYIGQIKLDKTGKELEQSEVFINCV